MKKCFIAIALGVMAMTGCSSSSEGDGTIVKLANSCNVIPEKYRYVADKGYEKNENDCIILKKILRDTHNIEIVSTLKDLCFKNDNARSCLILRSYFQIPSNNYNDSLQTLPFIEKACLIDNKKCIHMFDYYNPLTVNSSQPNLEQAKVYAYKVYNAYKKDYLKDNDPLDLIGMANGVSDLEKISDKKDDDVRKLKKEICPLLKQVEISNPNFFEYSDADYYYSKLNCSDVH